MARTWQLRLYRVQPDRMAEFVDGWRKGVVPLRERFGFRVETAWASIEDDTFCWVLSYDGDDGFAAADARYYASPERAGLDPDPAKLLAETRAILARPAIPAS
jgi:NIPSNAP